MIKLSQDAKKQFDKLYSKNGETIEDTYKRVSTEFAKDEKDFEYAYDILYNNVWRPNTPVFLNAGTNHKVFSACYVIGLEDSMESIYDIVNTSRKIFQFGAGVGIPVGNLREKEAYIYEGDPENAPEGRSSGPITFMKLFDAVGETTKSGGRVRRAAILCSMPVWHPDIMEFVNCKEMDGRLANMNISVNVTDNFMRALEDGVDIDLISPRTGEKVGTANAQDIWDRLSDMNWKSADPGIIFIDNMNKYNPLIKSYLVEATNPCIVGDTKIAVADGRNAISIKQLVKEGKDVPVYSTNVETGKVEIKWGRNPRKTGIQKEVWKLNLDDGSELIATPDHKILTKDLSYIDLKNLKKGMSVYPFNSFDSNGYRQIQNVGKKMKGGARRNRRQYRLIHEFFNGITDAKKYAIHHSNYDKTDDSNENLDIMLHTEHRKLHSENIMGNKNPYHRMSEEWKKRFASHPGETNGRYCGYTNEQLIEKGKELYKEFGKFTKRIWRNFAKDSDYPTNVGHEFRFGSFSNFKSLVIENHKVISVEFYGYEDVYNITVDDNHNYHIITSNIDDKFILSSGLCVKNCGEQPLLPFGCCNLSAINISKFVKNGEFDWNELYNVSHNVMGLMDNVIDVMQFPEECSKPWNSEIQKDRFRDTAEKYRQVGVGMMGLADALYMLGLRYDGPEGRKFAGKVMKVMTTACAHKSALLAEKHGPFYQYDLHKNDMERIIREHIGLDEPEEPELASKIKETWELVKKHGVRNSQFTTCQPTGTTALSCDASYGIEPIFGLVFYKNYIDGTVGTISNPIFRNMFKNEDWYTDELLEKIVKNYGSLKGIRGIPEDVRKVFVVAHEISHKARIDMQAEIQKYCSTAISSTINLPKEATKDDIAEIYKYAWQKGLKGVTTYRDGCKNFQPVTFECKEEKMELKELPSRLTAERFKIETGNGRMYVTVSDHKGVPLEVFIYLGKSGQILNTFSEAIGRLISIALQSGVPVETVSRTLMGINSDKPTWFRIDETDKKPTQILSIPDGIGQLLNRYYSGKKQEIISLGEVCPKCGSSSYRPLEGCWTCLSEEGGCGYSKCS